MLTVVEHDQGLLIVQIFLEDLKRRLASFLAETDCRKDRLRNQIRLGERCKFHEPDAMREPVEQIRCDLKRKTRLAGAAGPRERDKTVFTQRLFDLDDLLLASDK